MNEFAVALPHPPPRRRHPLDRHRGRPRASKTGEWIGVSIDVTDQQVAEAALRGADDPSWRRPFARIDTLLRTRRSGLRSSTGIFATSG